MDNIKNKIFEEANDALFFIKNQKIFEINKAGSELKEKLCFDLEKVLEVATGKGCAAHSTMDQCLNCELKAEWDQKAFPITFKRVDGQLEQFSGSYTIFDEQTSLLSLRQLDVQDRLQQVIQNKRLIEYVNQAHENERKSLSQELHDGLAQSIYSLMLETRQLKRLSSSEELANNLQKIDENFVAVLNEVKQMAVDLRPSALDDLGLIPAIETLLQRITKSTGVVIHFIPMISQKRFSDKIETITYRVLQESVMNSIKHAGVDDLWVTLKEEEGTRLVLTVRDHGKGFDRQTISEMSTGLGLYHMEERAESVGGTLTIQSEKSEGTTITLKLPIWELEL